MDFYVKGYTVTCGKCGKHIVDREYKMRDYIWPHPIEAKMVKRIGICDECQEKMAMEYRKWQEKEQKKEEKWRKKRLREQTIYLIREYNGKNEKWKKSKERKQTISVIRDYNTRGEEND